MILTNALKDELLNAISDIEIDSCDFYHEFDGDLYSSKAISKQSETDNLTFDITIEETVKWDGLTYYEVDNIECVYLKAWTQDDDINYDCLDSLNIDKYLNY